VKAAPVALDSGEPAHAVATDDRRKLPLLSECQESWSIVLWAQSHREASRRLVEVAEQQQGFFTTKQAEAAGFAENTHPYDVQVGNWVREHSGIYRLTLFPTTDRPELVLWVLWSRNRKEEVEGVYGAQPLQSGGSESVEAPYDSADGFPTQQ